MNRTDVQILGLGVAFGLAGWSVAGAVGAVLAFPVGTWIGGRLATLSERVTSLEARIGKLEAKRESEQLRKH